MKKVIIGAGPAGLYAAIKLRKAGIRDLVIYDPRAGSYTRPGHLNSNVFRRAAEGIEEYIPDALKMGVQTGHIKDLERILYAKAVSMGIRIEKKRFVRLHQDKAAPGVIVAGEDGAEEMVPTDYVFDCTGARREIINAVNTLLPAPAFKLVAVAEPPITHHFLAYVNVGSEREWNEIDAKLTQSAFVPMVSPLAYARSIVKLRALGWNEADFPKAYGQYFGKGKVCFYSHAPAGLRPENYDQWLQTVLDAYIGASVHYEHVKPSRKYSSKPRMITFTTTANALDKAAFKGTNLPTVVALGDTQIDPDYRRAHGIFNGMARINALFDHMEILNGDIGYFDADDYLSTINHLLREHKSEVAESAITMKRHFQNALENAKLALSVAIELTTNEDEKRTFEALLNEFEARRAYHHACQIFTEYHDVSKLLKPGYILGSTVEKLSEIQENLLKAISSLPATHEADRREAESLLIHLANSWKKIATDLFKANKFTEAIESYKKALEIYNRPHVRNSHVSQRLTLSSNLLISYLRINNYPEALKAAAQTLATYAICEDDPKPVALDKIMFNATKALCGHAKAALLEINAHAVVPADTDHAALISLISILPATYTEQESVRNVLLHLASNWKKIGDAKFSERQFAEAKAAYEKALDIYHRPSLHEAQALKRLTLYSNTAIVCLKQNQHAEALSAADKAYNLYERCPADPAKPSFAKIILNLVKALYEEAKNSTASDAARSSSLLARAQQLFATHYSLFPADDSQIALLARELRPLLSSSLSMGGGGGTLSVSGPAGVGVIHGSGTYTEVVPAEKDITSSASRIMPDDTPADTAVGTAPASICGFFKPKPTAGATSSAAKPPGTKKLCVIL